MRTCKEASMEGEDGKRRQGGPTYPKNLTDERVQVDVMRLFSLTMLTVLTASELSRRCLRERERGPPTSESLSDESGERIPQGRTERWLYTPRPRCVRRRREEYFIERSFLRPKERRDGKPKVRLLSLGRKVRESVRVRCHRT